MENKEEIKIIKDFKMTKDLENLIKNTIDLSILNKILEKDLITEEQYKILVRKINNKYKADKS